MGRVIFRVRERAANALLRSEIDALRKARAMDQGLMEDMRGKMDSMRRQLNNIVALLPPLHAALPIKTHSMPDGVAAHGYGYRVPGSFNFDSEGPLAFRDTDDIRSFAHKVHELQTWILKTGRSEFDETLKVRLVSRVGEVAYAISGEAARRCDKRALARILAEDIAPDMVAKMLEKMND